MLDDPGLCSERCERKGYFFGAGGGPKVPFIIGSNFGATPTRMSQEVSKWLVNWL